MPTDWLFTGSACVDPYSKFQLFSAEVQLSRRPSASLQLEHHFVHQYLTNQLFIILGV